VTTSQIEFSLNLLLILAYGFIKLSIVFFYKRLFGVDRSIFKLLTWIMTGFVVAWTVCFLFMFIFGCGTHVSAFWGSRLDLITYCGKGLQYEEGLYISEFVINFLLLVMPLPTIWRLHMPLSRKLGVTGILLLAFMAVIASVFRLVIVMQVSTTSYTAIFDEDETIATIYYWGMIEAGLALIACSLPSLKVLVSAQGLQSAINSVRSVVSLQSYNNGTTEGSKVSLGSKSARKNYNNLKPGGTDQVPLRGDNVMEMNSHIGYFEAPNQNHEPGSIMVQRDVSVHDTVK